MITSSALFPLKPNIFYLPFPHMWEPMKYNRIASTSVISLCPIENARISRMGKRKKHITLVTGSSL